MRSEHCTGALCDAEGLQCGRGFGVGERHGAELDKAHREGKKEGKCVKPACVFEMSVCHVGNCNRFKLSSDLRVLK